MTQTLPLLCPIAPAIHADCERVSAEAFEWVLDHGLVRSGDDLRTFSALRITEFIARAYPSAEPGDLRVVMDWTLWGFLADDEHDALADRPSALRARYRRYVDVLRGQEARDTCHENALADLRARILERGGSGCLRRFADAASDWFESMYWELATRRSPEPPPVTSYLRMREVTVGMYTEFALFDVTHQVRTDDRFWSDPDVRRLLALCSNVVAWANDVFSRDKEQLLNDPNNLVLLLGKTRGESLASAIDTVIRMHNLELRRFLELERAVRARPWPSRRTAEVFFGMLRAWIRANVDWANRSARYAVELSVEDAIDSGAGPEVLGVSA